MVRTSNLIGSLTIWSQQFFHVRNLLLRDVMLPVELFLDPVWQFFQKSLQMTKPMLFNDARLKCSDYGWNADDSRKRYIDTGKHNPVYIG
ncbi:hypothetical protein TH5_09140 [Thalassospira xianhensis MCCC 1A02616]|uniref:Uncharacterized protein n=1 Tax=Thalassospira xianhensis MCCC 1A02616 TaxID=1177929 RepID=A0A367UDG3_9PROT|nr:hypothetical protein TH5_09140 [Thalassospira xianhensis MCCC 1A02616]